MTFLTRRDDIECKRIAKAGATKPGIGAWFDEYCRLMRERHLKRAAEAAKADVEKAKKAIEERLKR